MSIGQESGSGRSPAERKPEEIRNDESFLRGAGSVAGGAMLGAALGGPIGALVGAGMGFFLGQQANKAKSKKENEHT